MYPEIMVIPMREELTRLGIQELRTAADVDRAITTQPDTRCEISRIPESEQCSY